MSEPQKPKVEVVVTPTGIEVVRLYGTSWSDQEPAMALYHRLAPLLRQIQEFLQPASNDWPGRKPS